MFRNRFRTPSPKVREPHFLWFTTPDEATQIPGTCTENSALTAWYQCRFLSKKSRYGNSVSTPHRQYGNDCARRLCRHRFQDFYWRISAYKLLILKGKYKRQTQRDKRSQIRSSSQMFADFCRFSKMPANYSIFEVQIFAESHRKPFAESCRKPQIFAETRLSHLVCPF